MGEAADVEVVRDLLLAPLAVQALLHEVLPEHDAVGVAGVREEEELLEEALLLGLAGKYLHRNCYRSDEELGSGATGVKTAGAEGVGLEWLDVCVWIVVLEILQLSASLLYFLNRAAFE